MTMIRIEAVFDCADNLTPDVAARLAAAAERYRAQLELECAGKRVLLGSLIGILSLECQRGTKLAVIAEGEDEQTAAEAIRDSSSSCSRLATAMAPAVGPQPPSRKGRPEGVSARS